LRPSKLAARWLERTFNQESIERRPLSSPRIFGYSIEGGIVAVHEAVGFVTIAFQIAALLSWSMPPEGGPARSINLSVNSGLSFYQIKARLENKQ